MKIVFLDTYGMGGVSLEPISRLGEFKGYYNSTPQEARQRASDCDVLIVNKIHVDRDLLDAAPGTKLVCEAATGVNNIDLEECEKRGIPVRNVAGYSTESVVQTTFMHILSLVGNGPYYDTAVKDGSYTESGIFTDMSAPQWELSGKDIGIIGMGAIGSRVAAVAKAFGMNVGYFSTSGTSHCKDYPSLPIEDLLQESDIVSIHAPLNDRTRNLIGIKELSMMKPSAILVNMGRGGIVDESALAEAVDNGTIAGAALDVFEKEPLSADSPLLHMKHPERMRYTPHTGWVSKEAVQRLVKGIAKNIEKGW